MQVHIMSEEGPQKPKVIKVMPPQNGPPRPTPARYGRSNTSFGQSHYSMNYSHRKDEASNKRSIPNSPYARRPQVLTTMTPQSSRRTVTPLAETRSLSKSLYNLQAIQNKNGSMPVNPAGKPPTAPKRIFPLTDDLMQPRNRRPMRNMVPENITSRVIEGVSDLPSTPLVGVADCASVYGISEVRAQRGNIQTHYHDVAFGQSPTNQHIIDTRNMSSNWWCRKNSFVAVGDGRLPVSNSAQGVLNRASTERLVYHSPPRRPQDIMRRGACSPLLSGGAPLVTRGPQTQPTDLWSDRRSSVASNHSAIVNTTTSRVYRTPKLSSMLDTSLGSGTCTGALSPQGQQPDTSSPSPPMLDLSDSGYSTSSCTSSKPDNYTSSQLTVRNLIVDVTNHQNSQNHRNQVSWEDSGGSTPIININENYKGHSPTDSLKPGLNSPKSTKSTAPHTLSPDCCGDCKSSGVASSVNGAWVSDIVHGNSLHKISHLRKSSRKSKAFLLTKLFGHSPDSNKGSESVGEPQKESLKHSSKESTQEVFQKSSKYPQVPLPSNGISWAGKLAIKLSEKTGRSVESEHRLQRSNTVSSLVEEDVPHLEAILLPSALPPQLRSRLSPKSSDTMNDSNSLPSTPSRKLQAQHSHVLVERIYCVRQLLNKVHDDSANEGRPSENKPVVLREPVRAVHTISYSQGHAVAECVNPLLARQANQEKLNLPERLMRPNRNSVGRRGSMKRSKSQPMHAGEQVDSVSPQRVMLRERGREGESDSAGSHSPPALDSTSTCRTSTYSTGSSVTSASCGSNETHVSWESAPDGGIMSEALWDHVTMQADELQFSVGDMITVCDWTHPNVWFGTCEERCGWFPASHVRLLANQVLVEEGGEESECVQSSVSEDIAHRQRQLRTAVVQEMLATEKDYLDLLKNLVEGFLHEARQREELFPADKVLTIFGNLEEIYRLHEQLLYDLESAIDLNDPASCLIGPCFIKYSAQFELYSNYCNNHPLSCNELANLYRHPRYRQFFECCRLLRGMPDLTLDAFLLTPVQRICKYPLQLAELVKSTPRCHGDAQACNDALLAMRRVASVINERKRRLEHLQKIAAWQAQVEGWQGPELLESSSMLVHSGEVTVRCMATDGPSFWSKELVAFLFDHTLVLCKKDILKRNHLIYKDSINMSEASVSTLNDLKDSFFGSANRYSWKVTVENVAKAYIFTVRSKKVKEDWLTAFNEQRNTALHTSNNPPTAEEKRIALFALKPAPSNASSVRLARKNSPSVHRNNIIDLPNSRSIPGKMWNRIGKPTKA